MCHVFAFTESFLHMVEDGRRYEIDVALETLAHIHRRRILVSLLSDSRDSDTQLDVDEVELDTEDPDRTVELVHVHLPKLEQHGYIEWDRDANEVSPGPQFTEIESMLELLHDNRDRLPSGWL